MILFADVSDSKLGQPSLGLMNHLQIHHIGWSLEVFVCDCSKVIKIYFGLLETLCHHFDFFYEIKPAAAFAGFRNCAADIIWTHRLDPSFTSATWPLTLNPGTFGMKIWISSTCSTARNSVLCLFLPLPNRENISLVRFSLQYVPSAPASSLQTSVCNKI